MKNLILGLLFAAASSALAYEAPEAPEAPTAIPVKCKIGEQVFMRSLTQCGHKTALSPSYQMKPNGEIDYSTYELVPRLDGAIGEYWCEGQINALFSVRFTGWMGLGRGVVRITYLPANITGRSPLEVQGLDVSCE